MADATIRSRHGVEPVQREPGRDVLVVIPVGELVKRNRAGREDRQP
jgi:hypothetical protein